MKIVKFDGTQAELTRIVSEETSGGLDFVEEMHDIPSGTFWLGFMEPSRAIHTVEDRTDARIMELSEQNLVIMDAIATLFETMGGA